MRLVLEWLPLNRDVDSCFCRVGLGGRVSPSDEGFCGTTGAAGFGVTSGAG